MNKALMVLIFSSLFSVLGVFLFYQISPFLTVLSFIFMIFCMIFVGLKLKKGEVIFLVLSFLISMVALKNLLNIVDDTVEAEECLILNEQYPGLENYEDCVKKITPRDYFINLVRLN